MLNPNLTLKFENSKCRIFEMKKCIKNVELYSFKKDLQLIYAITLKMSKI